MMCPGDVGRDSGEWGGQESEVLQDCKSHQELGEEALAEGAALGVGTECPKVLSDCYCCCCLVFFEDIDFSYSYILRGLFFECLITF